MRKRQLIVIFYLLTFWLAVVLLDETSPETEAAVLADKIPLVYFGLNEGSGTTTMSSGQHAIEATFSGGATWESANLPFAQDNQAAIRFDGVDDVVKVIGANDAQKLEVQGALTLAAWVYPTETAANPFGEGIILNKEGEYELARFTDGTLRWALDNTNPGWTWVNTGGQLPLNEWSHIAFVYADELDTAAAYINGVEVDRRTASGPINDHVPDMDEFWIGGRQALSDRFDGIIDEVYVFDQAIDRSQLVELARVPIVSCGPAAGGRSFTQQPMPGYQQPETPIPHREPGYSHAPAPSTPTQVRSADGVLEIEGKNNDPLKGGYDLVDLDQINLTWLDKNSNLTNDVTQASTKDQNGNYVMKPSNFRPNLGPIAGSQQELGTNSGTNAFDQITTDLNEDGQAESTLVWRPSSVASAPIHLKISNSVGTALLASEPVATVIDGTSYLFARGYDDALWVAVDDGNPLDWERCGGTLASGPAVAQLLENRVSIIVVGTDGALYERILTRVMDFEFRKTLPDAPVKLQSTPAQIAHADGKRDVFARAIDNTVWTLHSDGGDWGEWRPLGGYLASGPAVVAHASNDMTLLVTGFDGALWYRQFNKDWSNWKRVDTPQFDLIGAPTAHVTEASSFEVYGRADDNSLRSLEFNNGSAGAWQTLPVSTTVGSRPAVSITADGLTVYTTVADNNQVQRSVAGADWETVGSIVPGPVEINTGIIPDSKSPEIKAVSGHFFANGRQQLVLGFVNTEFKLELVIYDVAGGFVTSEVTRLTLPYELEGRKMFDMVVGDFDGDGSAELGVFAMGDNLAYLGSDIDNNVGVIYVVDWDGENNQLVRRETYLLNSIATTTRYYDVSITAGDFFGQGMDDLGIGYSLKTVPGLHNPGNAYVRFVDVAIDQSSDNWSITLGTPFPKWIDQGVNRLDIEVAAGDVTGPANNVRKDELLAITPGWQPTNPDWHEMHVWNVNEGGSLKSVAHSVQFRRTRDLPITFAVGDLDRDLTDEIVFGYYQNDGIEVLYLRSYELVANQSNVSWQITARGHRQILMSNTDDREAFPIAASIGDLTGQSLRVGKPTYRFQENVGNLIAVINAPPTHRDVVNGVEISVGDPNADNYYAQYGTSNGVTSELQIKSQRTYDLGLNAESTVGNKDETHVTASIGSSYGTNFEKGRGNLTQQTFSEQITAEDEDFAIFYGASYEVWEYPLYESRSGAPRNHISVVFPVAGSEAKYQRPLRGCDLGFLPTHELENIWSYPSTNNTNLLLGYDGGKDIGKGKISNIAPGGGESEWLFEMANNQSGTSSSSVSLGVTKGLETQIGGEQIDVSFDTPFGSIGKSFTTPSLKASMNQSYGSTSLSSYSITTTDEVKVGMNLGNIDADYNFSVQSYLYWAETGHLVLDHTVSPNASQVGWLPYANKPDPAFIRPNSDGSCATQGIDFSHGVKVTPAYASAGETVSVQATVHNFSAKNIGAEDAFAVHFYVGDPDNGGVEVGTPQTISDLKRTDGPITVETTFVASGLGEQRIYAVIDPINKVDEVHDTKNNKAYNLLTLAATDFVDPGQPNKDYHTLDFGTETDTATRAAAEDLTFSAHIPLKAMQDSIQFELRPIEATAPAPAGTSYFAKPFELTAWEGGDQTGIPQDIDLQWGDSTAPVGVLTVGYPASLADDELVLRRWNGTGWVDAGCNGREAQQMPEANRFVAPMCETGRYAIFSDGETPIVIVKNKVFLPLINR